MPALLYSDRVANTSAGATLPARSGNGLLYDCGKYSLLAALALNDVIQMVKVPQYATIVHLRLDVADLDTNGTPLIKFDVGDGNVTNRFINQSLAPRTGGSELIGFGITTNTHSRYVYTVEDTIDILVNTAPATGATSGTIYLHVWFDTGYLWS